MRIPVTLALGAAAAVLLPRGGAAETVIHVCVRPNGNLRIATSPGDCQASETSLSWNQQGPAGAAGPPGEQGPPGTSGPGPLRFELAGFTNETFEGNLGILALNLGCQGEFPGSRMCTSEEVFDTSTFPADLTGVAWVRPVSGLDGRDITGGFTFSHNCNGWADRRVTGLALFVSTFPLQAGFVVADPYSGFFPASCGTPRSVACCAPVE